MNWDVIKGRWAQLKGSVKETWGDLTDDDLTEAAGEREKLAGKLQARYGLAKAEAEKRVDDWSERLADDGGVTADEVKTAALSRLKAVQAQGADLLDELKDGWRDMSGSLKEKWAKLTDDDLEDAKGDSAKLVAKLQQKYGLAKDEAERQVKTWWEQARRAD